MNVFWWAVRDSNPRQSVCKTDTLPTELTARALFFLGEAACSVKQGTGMDCVPHFDSVLDWGGFVLTERRTIAFCARCFFAGTSRCFMPKHALKSLGGREISGFKLTMNFIFFITGEKFDE